MADDGRGNEARDVVTDDGDAGGRLGPHLIAALRRLLVVIVFAAAFTVVGSVILGLLLGASLSRSIAIGFYLVGSFWLVSGFFVGNRGPVRLKSDLGAPLFGSRFVRWATPEEREETINMSAIYVLLGFVLILFGFAADTRYSLF
ncbi:MAG TPA: hypothetical protein VHQ98_11200 [Gaiellaceae bacterium]|nr:hypothetical protein [Gaiellaceae bacterium]